MNKVIFKILIISLIIVFAFSVKTYCAEDGTVRMEVVDEGTAWTNINISESYKECESLNDETSTLGTSLLEAHLTTDYDWSIMAIFSVSQYGGATTNSPTSTTGNKSGIYDVGIKTHTTTLLNTSNKNSNGYVYGLYDENGNPKKYVNKINPTTGEDQYGRICILYLIDGGTKTWKNATTFISNDASRAVSIKLGLFGINFAYINNLGADGTGGPKGDVTFRPVIWN